MNVNVLLKRSQNEEKAFALCDTEPKAQKLNDEIVFFKAVKAGLVKLLQPSKEGKIYKTLAKVEERLIILCHNLWLRKR